MCGYKTYKEVDLAILGWLGQMQIFALQLYIAVENTSKLLYFAISTVFHLQSILDKFYMYWKKGTSNFWLNMKGLKLEICYIYLFNSHLSP